MTEARGESLDAVRTALQEAVSASKTAEATANAVALAINGTAVKPGLSGHLAEHTTAIDRLARKDRTQRFLIAALIVGFLLGGIFVWKFKEYQDCRARYTDTFLTLEKQKVGGQIDGIDEILTRDPLGGVNKFKAASQHYLDGIAVIDRC